MTKVAEIEAAEKDKMKEKCHKIIDHGITCFINRQLIYNYPEQVRGHSVVVPASHAKADAAPLSPLHLTATLVICR